MLTPEQEHMLLWSIKESYGMLGQREQEALAESLASERDGALLDKLLEMLQRVQAVAGGPQYMN